MKEIPYYKPPISEKEKRYVNEVLNLNNSTSSKAVELEEKFAQYVNSKYAIATNNGTSVCI